MKCVIVLLTLIFFCYCQPLNQRPIIGVLSQKQFGKEVKFGSSYIPASYVKFLEAAGARVVPILVNQTREYYEHLFYSLNGILFPGGGADIVLSGYGKAGKIIFDLSVKANDKGDYFPLWGTCLGFELLSYLAINKNMLKRCSVYDVALPLNKTKDFHTSKMFKNIPKEIENILTTKPVTVNYHNWCLTLSNYSKSGLENFFRVLTTSKYKNEVFISTFEAQRYPFYAVAWHPEKNQYEFVYNAKHKNIPHSTEAVQVSQYFANFFVNETRKSSHKFSSLKEEKETLIYNYQPVYTGIHGSSYEQKYFFNVTDLKDF